MLYLGNDVKDDVDLSAAFEGAQRRGIERQEVRARLEPIATALAHAESVLSHLGIFTSEEQLRLAHARLHVLGVLRSVDRACERAE